MAGKVVFSADTTQFIVPVQQMSAAVAASEKAVADARARIQANFLLQIKAAKEVGASQEELRSIYQAASRANAEAAENAASRLGRTLEQSTARNRKLASDWIAENNRIIESEKAKQRAVELAALRADIESRAPNSRVSPVTSALPFLSGYGKEAEAVAAISSQAARATRELGEAHEASVPKMAAASAGLRALRGDLTQNLRAGERFASMLPGVSTLLETAFPVIGAVALGSALFEMGSKAYHAFQNIVMLQGAIESLNTLDITIAKKVESDADAAEASVEGILERTQGKVASLQQRYKYQGEKGVDLSDLFYNDAVKNLPDRIKVNYESLYKAVAPADIPDRLRKISTETKQLQAALDFVRSSDYHGFNPRVGDVGPATYEDPEKYYSARLKLAQDVQRSMSSQLDKRGAALNSVQTEIPVAQAEQAKKLADDAKRTRTQALEAQRKAAADQRAEWDNEYAEWAAETTRSSWAVALYWQSKAAEARAGSANYLDAIKKSNVALRAVHAETARLEKENAKVIAELWSDMQKGQRKDEEEGIEAIRQRGIAIGNNLQERVKTKQGGDDALSLMSVDQAEATGKISKEDAAFQRAALHAAQYARALEEIQNARDQIAKDDPDAAVKNSQLSIEQAKLDAANKLTVMQDNAKLAAASWQGALKNANALWVQDSLDSARQVAQLYSGLVDGINANISNALSTLGERGHHHVGRDLRNAVGGTLRGVGGQMVNSGLRRVEAGIFGGGKPDGSKQNPHHVIVDNQAAAAPAGTADAVAVASTASTLIAGSSIGGDVGKFAQSALSFLPGGNLLAGAFGGFRAMGGGVEAGSSYIVGEHEPEVFSPGRSGFITPLSKVGGGSGDTHHWHIDARGSNDPAAVRAQVMQGIREAAPHIVAASRTAQKEEKLRSPRGY